MKKAILAGVLLAAPVFANAYSWDQTIDFNPDPHLSFFNSYTFTHDLKTQGFNPGVDNISGYSLTINLYNDGGKFDAVFIDQPGFAGDDGALLYNWTYSSLVTGDSFKGLASLNADGLLNVSITSLFGSFYVDSSELKASGSQGNGIGSLDAAVVPEPTSLALLAAGLLGIAVMRRSSNKAS